jgi:hypothetical protein
MCLIDSLLNNDHKTNNEITAVARQRPGRSNGSGVFYVVRSESISLDRPSSVQLMQLSEVE